MTLTFTDEQFDALKTKAEWFLKSAVYSSTIRSAPLYITEFIANTYEQATGAKVKRDFGCAVCVLNLYRMVGLKYFEDKKTREQEDGREDKHAEPNSGDSKKKKRDLGSNKEGKKQKQDK